MLVTFIFILILLLMWHIAYSAVFAPVYRANYRFKIIALRDKLRRYEIKNPGKISDHLYKYLDAVLSFNADHIYNMNIFNHISMQRYRKRNPKFQKEISKILTDIESSDIDEIKYIYKNLTNIYDKVLILNTGELFPYLLPFLIILFISYMCYKGINYPFEFTKTLPDKFISILDGRKDDPFSLSKLNNHHNVAMDC